MSGGDIGKAGEDAAARYLRKNGCKILERNFSTPLGEIDIIALDGEVVCFVEVRSRSSADFGSAVEKLPRRKQRQVTKAALAYLKTKHLEDADIRFDYAAVVIPREGKSQVDLIRDAFQPRESMRGR